MNTIALILARGGSKVIPRKNIIDFCGKPLISWSIKQAKQVKEISSVWVSSDNKEILSVAKGFGANTIHRPKELSLDYSSSESGWLHAITEIEKMGYKICTVVAMQPTSPVREPRDLENGLKIFREQKLDSLFSACRLDDFLFWRDTEGHLESLNYDYKNRGFRQYRSAEILENGSFYVFKPEILANYNNRLGGKIGYSLMEIYKAFEIDDQETLELCRTLMKQYVVRDAG